jgi:hypothetical protein
MIATRSTLFIAVIASAAMLVGCDPLTKDRFDMIRVDVSDTLDVDKTIGKPTYTLPDQWHYERPTKHLNVVIDFNKNGTVSRKQWIDANVGQWDDSQPAGDTNTKETIKIKTYR